MQGSKNQKFESVLNLYFCLILFILLLEFLFILSFDTNEVRSDYGLPVSPDVFYLHGINSGGFIDGLITLLLFLVPSNLFVGEHECTNIKIANNVGRFALSKVTKPKAQMEF